MKKIILIFCALVSLALLIFIISFDSNEVKFNTVAVEGKFSISIPEYLTKTDSLDSSALLQYKNEKEQMFLLVYEKTDTTNSSLEEYFKTFSDKFISGIDHGTLLKYYPEKINRLDALLGNIRGTVSETGVYYRIAVIKRDSRIYEMIFGISENYKSTYEEDMNSIIESFNPAVK